MHESMSPRGAAALDLRIAYSELHRARAVTTAPRDFSGYRKYQSDRDFETDRDYTIGVASENVVTHLQIAAEHLRGDAGLPTWSGILSRDAEVVAAATKSDLLLQPRNEAEFAKATYAVAHDVSRLIRVLEAPKGAAVKIRRE